MKDPHTRAVHAGRAAHFGAALSVPIVQSSTFALRDTAHGAALSAEINPAELYTRWGNPTTRVLEQAVADLEGGEGALAFSSGMAAMSTAVIASVSGGDHVIAARHLYGGSVELLGGLLRRFGVDSDVVDFTDLDAVKAAVRPNTRLMVFETPANPTVDVVDIAGVVEIARARGVRTIIDNTWATPWNQTPLALGVDGVVHSATKALGGHSDVIAGVVVGSRTWLDEVWSTQKLLGGCISPHDAWLVIRGIKTLGVRQARAGETALTVAGWLAEHPAVLRVHHPGLPSHPGHAIAARQMRTFGSMLALELADRERAAALAEAVELITHAVSLGGVESLVCHPASTTHAALDEAALAASGIAPGLLRMSIGLEAAEDLIADLSRALQ